MLITQFEKYVSARFSFRAISVSARLRAEEQDETKNPLSKLSTYFFNVKNIFKSLTCLK